MKIRNDKELLENQQLLSESIKRRQKEALGAQVTREPTSQDSVSIPLGRAVQETLESLASRSDRTARVAEIKQLIQKSGVAEYFKQVPSEKVAASFLDEVNFEIATEKGLNAVGDE